jgi:hypothetical protein
MWQRGRKGLQGEDHPGEVLGSDLYWLLFIGKAEPGKVRVALVAQNRGVLPEFYFEKKKSFFSDFFPLKNKNYP